MQPGPVGAEQELAARAPGGLFEDVEAAYAGRVGVDVRPSHQLIHQRHLGTPIVRERPQVRDDPVHAGVLLGEKFHG